MVRVENGYIFLFNDAVFCGLKMSFRRMRDAIMQYNSEPLSGFVDMLVGT